MKRPSIATLSRLSLAVVMLNTSIYITPDSSTDFLEDDASFTQVTDAQSSGWHWGISSANACNNAHSFSDCIPVYGQDPGDLDYGFGDFGGVGYGDHDNGGGDYEDDDGGGSTGNTTPPVDNTQQIEQCKETALNNKNQCVSSVETQFGLTVILCNSSSDLVCMASARISRDGKFEDCNTAYNTAVNACN